MFTQTYLKRLVLDIPEPENEYAVLGKNNTFNMHTNKKGNQLKKFVDKRINMTSNLTVRQIGNEDFDKLLYSLFAI